MRLGKARVFWSEAAVNNSCSFLCLLWNIQLHMKLYIIMRYVHKLSCCAMTELYTVFVSKPFYSQNFVLLRDYTKILALNRQNSLYNSDSGSYNINTLGLFCLDGYKALYRFSQQVIFTRLIYNHTQEDCLI